MSRKKLLAAFLFLVLAAVVAEERSVVADASARHTGGPVVMDGPGDTPPPPTPAPRKP